MEIKSAKKIFITGVDTDIGKTFTALGLCLASVKSGKKTAYFKPFQSGSKNGIAPDVFEMQKFLDIPCGYSYLSEGEVSPYMASLKANVEIDIQKAIDDINKFGQGKDIEIIEGAGGLLCPVKKGYTYCDFIKQLDVPAIIVTTPDLGRINHTLMTLEIALKREIDIKGIIVNRMPDEPNDAQRNFVKELSDFADTKILKVIPEIKTADREKIEKAFLDII